MKYLTTIALLIGSVVGSGALSALAESKPDRAPVEIIVGGKKFSSMEVYRQEQMFNELSPKKKDEVKPPTDEFAEMRQMFNQAVHSSKQPLDLQLDPAKMKTVFVKAQPSAAFHLPPHEDQAYSDPWMQAYTLINKVGFEDGVRQVVSQFGVTRGISQVIKADELEKVLRDSFGDLNKPLLLISDRTSVRVMTLDSGEDANHLPQGDSANHF